MTDYEKLRESAGFDSYDVFQAAHRNRIEYSLANCGCRRESQRTESIAAGSSKFVKRIKSQLGAQARGRKIIEAEESFQICEDVESYNALFDAEKCDIAPNNTRYWNVFDEFPVG